MLKFPSEQPISYIGGNMKKALIKFETFNGQVLLRAVWISECAFNLKEIKRLGGHILSVVIS